MLIFCELHNYSIEIPTWVPDWSDLACTNAPRATLYVSGYTRANVINISEYVLELTGLQVATIAECTVLNIGDGTEAQVI
jgi:hypothetical protein